MPEPLKSVPIVVFDSYSHADEELHDELAKHLKPLEREGIIQRWHDRQITAGREFGSEIDDVLNLAGIICSWSVLISSRPSIAGAKKCYALWSVTTRAKLG